MLCSQVPHAQREERQKADVIFEIILYDEISNISQQGELLSGEPRFRPSPPRACVCSRECSELIGTSGKRLWLLGPRAL